MGLDMYLHSRFAAPTGSPLAKVIDEHVPDSTTTRATLGPSPDWREVDWGDPANLRASWRHSLDDPDDGNVYIGGWSHASPAEKAFYDALCVETGVTPDGGSPHFIIFPDGPGYLVDPAIMYWRKANAIHRWFVENVQGGVDECEPNDCTREQLLQLVEACELVHLNHDRAPELLPSQAGFFFGGTEYDGWYFQEIEQTAIHLKAAVQHAPESASFYYVSSW